MKVRMLSTAAGPEGVILSGTTLDLPPAKAKAFIDAHAAVPADTAAPVMKPAKPGADD
jgi:hypothetical protein